MAELIALLITLLTVAITVCGSLFVTVVSVAVPLVILVVVVRQLASGGGQIVVSGPAVALAAAAAGAARPADRGNDNLVKRCTCPSCGAPKSLPSRSAYVYCDRCGQLMDWDFKASLADPRSRMPGPQYEALLRLKRPALDRAKAEGDEARYEEVQRELFDSYVKACPAACSPRIGDPRYREAFVGWSARSQTRQDLDEACAATMAEQARATSALVWDRSNPFQPRIQVASFMALLDAVLAHQAQVLELLEAEGLLASHPDHPSADVFRKIGVSVIAQGWLAYLPKDAQAELLARTGLEDDYVDIEPLDLLPGVCAGCSAPLEVVPGATRVVCYACGRMAAVGSGELPCHGCGAPIHIEPEADRTHCAHCDVVLERMRIPGLGG